MSFIHDFINFIVDEFRYDMNFLVSKVYLVKLEINKIFEFLRILKLLENKKYN